MTTLTLDKTADLAGPGIGSYEELEKILPRGYRSLLSPKDTQKAITAAKTYIEDNLCRELNLIRVTVPLIVDAESGVNDYLDRDGSRTPIEFRVANDGVHTIDAQVVQAATKWKRVALKQFGMEVGEGLYTDMHAVRKDYFLDHDHSVYVDQWDWELVVTEEQRNLRYLKEVVQKLWRVLKGAERHVQELFPALAATDYPNLPEELEFFHAEEILERFPELPRKARETAMLQDHPAIFIYGIGWTLADGYPHELRAPDYDDWVTETVSEDGRTMHGLNGDILVWNPVTQRRHELSSMGIRVKFGVAQEAARADGPARLPEVALPPGDSERRDPALDRRGHRPVPDLHAAAQEGAPRRGERLRVAEDPEGNVPREEHPRAGVSPVKPASPRSDAAWSPRSCARTAR